MTDVKTLTVAQVADVLGITGQTVRQRASSGEIPGAINRGTKTRKYWIFDAEKFGEFVDGPTISSHDAAKLVGVTASALQKRSEKGTLEVVGRRGRTNYYRVKDIEAIKTEREAKTARFAKAYGASDKTVEEIIRRNLNFSPESDERTALIPLKHNNPRDAMPVPMSFNARLEAIEKKIDKLIAMWS